MVHLSFNNVALTWDNILALGLIFFADDIYTSLPNS